MKTARFRFNGINLDIDPVDLPPDVWTYADNMIPRPKGMERAKGYAAVFDPPAVAPIFVIYSEQRTLPYWVYASDLKVYSIDPNGVHTDITNVTHTTPVQRDEWSGCHINGAVVLNSFQNDPVIWEHVLLPGGSVVLPGLRPNTRYRVMRAFKYHLIGLGVNDDTGDYRDQIHWSDAAPAGAGPTTWVPADDNEAGDAILSDEDGAIIDGLALRDAFYIYKSNTVYEMTYSGGADVMRIRKVFNTTGALATGCIARVRGSHVVLGRGDIYQHDGQNVRSICDDTVRESFFGALDDTNYPNSFVIYLETLDEVWFCVPTTGYESPNLALVWHVPTEKWGYRAIPNTDHAAPGIVALDAGAVPAEDWDSDAEPWDADITRWTAQTFSITEDALLMADSTNTKLYRGNTGVDHDGVAYDAGVTRLSLDLGDPHHEKAIRRIWPVVNAPDETEFQVNLYNQRDPRSGQELVASETFKIGGNRGVPININARYLGVEVRCNASVPWDVSGFDIDYMTRGRF